MQITLYNPANKNKWDEFVAGSKNGTFLFYRDYMDYHADRFEDHSLIISDEKGGILALLPANVREHVIASHEGLTYGGFITDNSMTTPLMVEIFDQVTDYMVDRGFKKIRYKTIPHIYHTLPAEEDRYGLFQYDATLYRRDAWSVIDFGNILKYRRGRVGEINKALRNHVEVRESDDYQTFWGILTKYLQIRHGAKPVHSLDEINLLVKRFPNRIKLIVALKENQIQAGLVIYLTDYVCRLQYVGVSEEGVSLGAYDLIIDHLIKVYRESKKYLDFGASTYENGRQLNVGLINFKEGFGARTIVHDFYEIDLKQKNKIQLNR